MIDRDQLVRKRAYYLWEHAGRPHDRQDEFWHRANSEIDAETVVPVPSPGAARRTPAEALRMDPAIGATKEERAHDAPHVAGSAKPKTAPAKTRKRR
jgi:hypothetical protein